MINSAPLILVVDDSKENLVYMEYNLGNEGYKIITANSGPEALELTKTERPQLIILDLMMPETDGIEVCEELRNNPNLTDTLIVFWSARSEDYSLVAAYEAGADDYITKPIKPKLLKSKIKALLKRYSKAPQVINNVAPYEVGTLVVDRERYTVSLKDIEMVLPKKEFELIELLASNPNKVFTRKEIYTNVWGTDFIVGERTIDVHIRKLREKLGDDTIKTIKGIGYRLAETV